MRDNPEAFQIPTLLVAASTLFICVCYLLIFVNPQVSLNPFKPPVAVPTQAGAMLLPPTWTPTITPTPSPTLTPSLTPPPTLTPTFTRLPTNSPTITRTRTRTPLPIVISVPPTVSPYPYRTVFQRCQHSGGTFIEGTVFHSGAGDPESGGRVALSSAQSGAEVFIESTGKSTSPGYYLHVLNPNGAQPGTYFVWVVDGGGNALSNPSEGKVSTNSLGPDDPNACWRAVVDFVRR